MPGLNPVALLLALAAAGVAVRPHGRRLRVSGGAGALSPSLQASVKASRPALLALLTGPLPRQEGPMRLVVDRWPDEAHELALDLEGALTAAGAEQPAERTFWAVAELVAAWRSRLGMMPPGMDDAATLAWEAVLAGKPLPEPADRSNPWSWRAPEQLRLAREALRRGAGLPACGEV